MVRVGSGQGKIIWKSGNGLGEKFRDWMEVSWLASWMVVPRGVADGGKWMNGSGSIFDRSGYYIMVMVMAATIVREHIISVKVKDIVMISGDNRSGVRLLFVVIWL